MDPVAKETALSFGGADHRHQKQRLEFGLYVFNEVPLAATKNTVWKNWCVDVALFVAEIPPGSSLAPCTMTTFGSSDVLVGPSCASIISVQNRL